MTRMTRRQFAFGAVAAGATSMLSACGTLMYPERKNRPHSNVVNRKVLWCDIIGIVLFGIFGIIGMAIDFQNGTMYLPRGHASTGRQNLRQRIAARLGRSQDLIVVQLPADQRSIEDYERVASEHFGRTISLSDASLRHEVIETPRQFFPRVRRLLGRDSYVPVA